MHGRYNARSSQLQDITTLRLVPNYTASWWARVWTTYPVEGQELNLRPLESQASALTITPPGRDWALPKRQLIEMPFELLVYVGLMNYVLDGVQIPHGKGKSWGWCWDFPTGHWAAFWVAVDVRIFPHAVDQHFSGPAADSSRCHTKFTPSSSRDAACSLITMGSFVILL